MVESMTAPLGYDRQFLGLPIPLPTPTGGVPTVVLDYTHFSVVHRPDRRLAAVSAVNIHGQLLIDVQRNRDVWLLDPRLPTADQADNNLYTDNAFDRGHLTRRRDPCWGTPSDAKIANDDTFHYTNAAPQASVFNQSKETSCGSFSGTHPGNLSRTHLGCFGVSRAV